MRPRLWIAAAALWACGEDRLGTANAAFVPPGDADFGTVNVGTPVSMDLPLRNAGRAPLHITSAEVTESKEYFHVAGNPELVEGGLTRPLALVFTAPAPGNYEGSLLIKTDDPVAARATAEVALKGKGGIAKIELPPSIDFETVDEGKPAQRSFRIRNVGQAPLRIESVAIAPGTTDEFSVSGPETPLSIAPDDGRDFLAGYDPKVLGQATGAIVVKSDDHETAEAQIALAGTANLRPLAVAVDKASGLAETNVKPRSTVTVTAAESSDPEGGALVFAWQLERPLGSIAAIHHAGGDDPEATFPADVPGSFRATVTATDPRGLQSLPATAVLHAVRDFMFVLTWDHATDLDLHFVRPAGTLGDYDCSGSPPVCGGSDCSFVNRAPDWDPPGPDSDPSLDIDSTVRGPETVSIDKPAEGEYRVFVHYCGRPNETNPEVTAKVALYKRNEVVQSFGPMQLDAPGAVWEVARVTLAPELTFTATPVGAMTTAGLCR